MNAHSELLMSSGFSFSLFKVPYLFPVFKRKHNMTIQLLNLSCLYVVSLWLSSCVLHINVYVCPCNIEVISHSLANHAFRRHKQWFVSNTACCDV